eukprot:101513_1
MATDHTMATDQYQSDITNRETEAFIKFGATYKYTSVDVDIDIEPDGGRSIWFDFLIDGFVRSECNRSTSQIFPIAVKEVIISYYNENGAQVEQELNAFVNSKKRKQMLRDEFVQYWQCKRLLRDELCFIIIALLTSIAAITISIASHAEIGSTHCNANHYSLIDPALFTIIGSIVCVLHIILASCRALIIYYSVQHVEAQDCNMNWIKHTHNYLYLSGALMAWIMLLFYGVWCIIGFILYHNEMSYDCKHNIIGQMMISWSVILFVLTLCYYAKVIFARSDVRNALSVCCSICCYGYG